MNNIDSTKNNTHKTRGFSWGIGAATLMCIFTVMLLTVFSVLSFMTAESEVKNSDKFARSIMDYYAADSVASHFYGDILGILDTSQNIDEVSEKIRELDFTSFDSVEIEFSGETALSVSACTNLQNDTGRNIKLEFIIDDTMSISIVKWTAYSLSAVGWEADDSLDLWLPD